MCIAGHKATETLQRAGNLISDSNKIEVLELREFFKMFSEA